MHVCDCMRVVSCTQGGNCMSLCTGCMHTSQGYLCFWVSFWGGLALDVCRGDGQVQGHKSARLLPPYPAGMGTGLPAP